MSGSAQGAPNTTVQMAGMQRAIDTNRVADRDFFFFLVHFCLLALGKTNDRFPAFDVTQRLLMML